MRGSSKRGKVVREETYIEQRSSVIVASLVIDVLSRFSLREKKSMFNITRIIINRARQNNRIPSDVNVSQTQAHNLDNLPIRRSLNALQAALILAILY